MNLAMNDLCNLVANEGARYALHHNELLLEIINDTTDRTLSYEQRNVCFEIFSFLNWAFATGVWSILDNPSLRRDLMEQSLKSIVIKTSYELSKDKSNEAVAFLASELDGEFRSKIRLYNERINEMALLGIEIDANAVTLVGLEWIQEEFELDDYEMSIIVPEFLSRVGDIAKIEQIALQVNRAVEERGKKGVFDRFKEGFSR
ncbi:hypothetical protein [Alkaliphilus hydrothermalis]|uniref:Uncharacterized protein n=1 Tax=Alkaliphilus hydrothermalis TaxID=1482730 RepID=A0ABS2NPD0_9FIRM|nr:hypothetical protein [Alkaliphilus hydrothermalis]MBM7614804.1 hypothetical protein [Alkaliphilus hydrothermalis]